MPIACRDEFEEKLKEIELEDLIIWKRTLDIEEEVSRLDNTIQTEEYYLPNMPLPKMKPEEIVKAALSIRPKDSGRYEEWADKIVGKVRSISLVALQRLTGEAKTLDEVDDLLNIPRIGSFQIETGE